MSLNISFCYLILSTLRIKFYSEFGVFLNFFYTRLEVIIRVGVIKIQISSSDKEFHFVIKLTIIERLVECAIIHYSITSLNTNIHKDFIFVLFLRMKCYYYQTIFLSHKLFFHIFN